MLFILIIYQLCLSATIMTDVLRAATISGKVLLQIGFKVLKIALWITIRLLYIIFKIGCFILDYFLYEKEDEQVQHNSSEENQSESGIDSGINLGNEQLQNNSTEENHCETGISAEIEGPGPKTGLQITTNVISLQNHDEKELESSITSLPESEIIAGSREKRICM